MSATEQCMVSLRGVTVLNVVEELDINSSRSLRRKAEELLQERKDLLLNLSGTDYIDSTGLSALIYLKKKQEKENCRLGLCSLRDSVRRIMKITNLLDFFLIFNSEQDAVTYFTENTMTSLGGDN